jgi:hypothetical protein
VNPNKLLKLFELATGEQPKTRQIAEVKTNHNKKKISSAKSKLSKYRGVYKDPLKAWQEWFREIRSDITSNSADDIWTMAEQEFPGSPDDAKNWLRGDIAAEIEDSDPVIKEQKLRNRMMTSPEWAAQENLPELNRLGGTVTNQNLTKVRAMYATSLEQKIMQLQLTELDPDVPIEVHVEDLMTLESLNALDGAQIVNGRVSVVNPNGQVQPAFSVREAQSKEMDPTSPELQMVYSVAPRIFKEAVESAIAVSQENLKLANKAASGASINMLKNGSLPMDEWGNALNLIGDKTGGIGLGLEGMLAKKPNMSEEELLMHSTDAYLKYGGLE